MRRPSSKRPARRAAAGAGNARVRLPAELRKRLERVRLVLCDVDGVLTDATISVGSAGEFKRFCVRDGLAQRFLREAGILVGWVSNRLSPATTQRAEELKVDFLFQERSNKVAAVTSILEKAQVSWTDLCYLGDDVVDLGVLKRAGLAVAVENAIPEAKAMAHYVTRAAGGQGAVREVADLILRAQGRWDQLLQSYAD